MNRRVVTVAKAINCYIGELEGRRGEEFEDVVFDEFIHVYGVSYLASTLAHRRGLNPEIACVIGLLHDSGRIIRNILDKSHGPAGALEAERILRATDLFREEEIKIICESIATHSDKGAIGNEYQELIKDADVLERLFSMGERYEERPNRRRRLREACETFGLSLKTKGRVGNPPK
jgi:HD superfamily phosphodiesterase